MQIQAKVHEVGATQQVSESFKKRDLIVAYAENPQFVEYIRFEATQDRVSIFDDLKPGDDVEVHFNLRGRPWTNKDNVTTYFNSLVAWRIQKLAEGSVSTPTPTNNIAEQAANEPDDSDLPF